MSEPAQEAGSRVYRCTDANCKAPWRIHPSGRQQFFTGPGRGDGHAEGCTSGSPLRDHRATLDADGCRILERIPDVPRLSLVPSFVESAG